MRTELLQYSALAKFLKDALGERYTVSLVDAEDLKKQWTASDHALNVHSMDDGQICSLLSDILGSTELKKLDYLCSVSDVEKVGAGEKNSVFYIRAENGEIAGFLCIYEVPAENLTVRDVFNQILETGDSSAESATDIAWNIGEEIESLIDEHIKNVWNRHTEGKKKLSKAEKVAFVSELLDSGVFRMKGTAERVTVVSGIPQASVYRYLSEAIEE